MRKQKSSPQERNFAVNIWRHSWQFCYVLFPFLISYFKIRNKLIEPTNLYGIAYEKSNRIRLIWLKAEFAVVVFKFAGGRKERKRKRTCVEWMKVLLWIEGKTKTTEEKTTSNQVMRIRQQLQPYHSSAFASVSLSTDYYIAAAMRISHSTPPYHTSAFITINGHISHSTLCCLTVLHCCAVVLPRSLSCHIDKTEHQHTYVRALQWQKCFFFHFFSEKSYDDSNWTLLRPYCLRISAKSLCNNTDSLWKSVHWIIISWNWN